MKKADMKKKKKKLTKPQKENKTRKHRQLLKVITSIETMVVCT